MSVGATRYAGARAARLLAGGVEGPASAAPWAGGAAGSLDAVYACNGCHISPYAVTQGIFSGASDARADGGRLCIYGPVTINK